MTEGERIKELRSALSKNGDKMTLEKFGERLGVAKTTISRLENGVNALTDQMARAICREFRVREEWLRTGEGPMFIQMTRDEQIRSVIEQIEGLKDSFKYRLISALCALDENEWELLEKTARLFVRILDEDEEARAEAEIRKEVADYERQVRAEREAGAGSEASKSGEGA